MKKLAKDEEYDKALIVSQKLNSEKASSIKKKKLEWEVSAQRKIQQL